MNHFAITRSWIAGFSFYSCFFCFIFEEEQTHTLGMNLHSEDSKSAQKAVLPHALPTSIHPKGNI